MIGTSIVAIGSVIGAWLSDRRQQHHPRPSRYGILPIAAPVLVPTVEVGLPIVLLILRMATEASTDPWDEDSDAWNIGLQRAYTQALSEGIPIRRACAWILHPYLIALRVLHHMQKAMEQNGVARWKIRQTLWELHKILLHKGFSVVSSQPVSSSWMSQFYNTLDDAFDQVKDIPGMKGLSFDSAILKTMTEGVDCMLFGQGGETPSTEQSALLTYARMWLNAARWWLVKGLSIAAATAAAWRVVEKSGLVDEVLHIQKVGADLDRGR